MSEQDQPLLVEVRVYHCGCLAAHTTAADGRGNALAETEYCDEGLRFVGDLEAQRDLVRETDFADERWAGRFARLEEIEEELHAHRLAAGVLHRARRPHDPRKVVGGVPKPSPSRRSA